MHMSCYQRLCFATTTFLLAWTTLCQITSSQTLPSALQTAIPICAQPCVEEAIEQDFVPSICPNPTDLDCLCSHYGPDGYTLGERAFGCLYSGNCTSASQANAVAVYTICAEQNNAVTPTHSTVVITAIQPTSTGDPTSTAMAATPDPAMTSAAAAATSAPSTTQAAMNSSPTAGASRSSSSIQLTEAQVAGIAIASIALVVLTVGIAGCLLFIRRRNKNLEMEDSKLLFHHSRNPSGSQTSHLGTPWKDPRGGPGGVGIVHFDRSLPPERQTSAQPERPWPRYYPVMPGADIGIAQTTNVPTPMPASPTAPAVPVVVNQMPMPAVPSTTRFAANESERPWMGSAVPVSDRIQMMAPAAPTATSSPRNVNPAPERPRSGHRNPRPVSDYTPTATSSPRNVNPAPARPRAGYRNPQPVSDHTPMAVPAPMADSSPRNINPAPERHIASYGTSQPPPERHIASSGTSQPPPERHIASSGTSHPPPERHIASSGTSSPVAEATISPTKRGRRSIDPTATLSQITEFEEEGIILRPMSHSPRQRQQQQQQPPPPPPPPPPSQPDGQDQDRGRALNRPAIPSLRATSGSPRLHNLRPSTLKIRIPSYPTTAVGPAETTFVTSYQPPQTQPQQLIFPVPPSKATVRSQQPLRIITNPAHPPQLYNQRPSPNTANHSRFANHAPQKPKSAHTTALVGMVPTAANLAKNRAAKVSNIGSRRSQRSPPVATRESMASFTSFESLYSEQDATPPKEMDTEWSAPADGGSPISNLRYPKIPRSSSDSASRIPPSPKNGDSPIKVSPLRMSPSSPSPRNKVQPSSPRGVVDQLWRTEIRQEHDSTGPSPIANPTHEPQHKFHRDDSRQQFSRRTGTSQQPSGSSPPKPTNGQPGRWNFAPDVGMAIAHFNPKSPFGAMPKLTPTKQGEDLYLSVSRD